MPDVDAGEQDLLALTAGQTRRVRPEFVNYAKRAKRVDVRKLKENIWRGLDIKIAESKEPQGEDGDQSMVCARRFSISAVPTFFICCRKWTTRALLIRPKLVCSALSFQACR